MSQITEIPQDNIDEINRRFAHMNKLHAALCDPQAPEYGDDLLDKELDLQRCSMIGSLVGILMNAGYKIVTTVTITLTAIAT